MSELNIVSLFLKLASPNKEGMSRWIGVNEFVGEFAKLQLGNGGSWCRFDSKFGKKNKIVVIKINAKNNYSFRYSWEITNEESKKIEDGWNGETSQSVEIPSTKGTKIQFIKLHGFQNQEYLHPIASYIRTIYQNKACVVCGSRNDTVVDHKNGLYNDPRVLNIELQSIDDFQVLCNHCNLQKRQTIKKMKKSGKRYPATSIPSIAMFNVDFTDGTANYDPLDPKWGVGTYWNDPIEFISNCVTKLKQIPL